jgi:hypothetical protein
MGGESMPKKPTRRALDNDSDDEGDGNLGFWAITTHVNNDFGCVAGKQRSDLQDQKKYKTRPDAPFSLLSDIFDKMEKAFKDGKDFITVTLEPDPAGGQFIVPDPKPSARPAALGAAKKAAPKKTSSRTKRSAKGKGKDGK